MRADVILGGRRTCYRGHVGLQGGTPVLLVHGLNCSSEAFVPLMDRWAAEAAPVRAVAPDMPGFGRSAGPREALDISGLAHWLLEFLGAIATPRVHVIAHSMGGQVALALARQAPRQVASLALIGPTSGLQLEGAARQTGGLIADSAFESLMWNWTLARTAWQMGPRRALATLRHMWRERPLDRADEVRCPVLVLRGRRDTIVSDRVARRLAASLPAGLYRELSVGAHAVQFTHPGVVWAACRSFFAAAEEAPRERVVPAASGPTRVRAAADGSAPSQAPGVAARGR